LILPLAVFVFFGLGTSKLRITEDASSGMLPTESLQASQYSDYLKDFPSDQSVLIVLEKILCSAQGWKLFQDLEAEINSLGFVEKTTSIASDTARYVAYSAEEVDLAVFQDVEFADDKSRCESASKYPPFRETLVTRSAHTAALVLLTSLDVDAVTLTSQIQRVVDSYREVAQELGGDLILTGEPVMSAGVSKVVASDTVFIVVNVLLMLMLLFYFTRSILSVAAAFILNIFVLCVAYGAMGWLGVMLTPATSLVVFLLIPLSSALVIHAYGYCIRVGVPERLYSFSRLAFLLAGLTTAIGFASTGLTPAVDIQRLAGMGVLGICAAIAGVYLIVFPILERGDISERSVNLAVPITLITNPYLGYGFFATLVVITIYGLSQLSINYSPTNYLPSTNVDRIQFDRAGAYFGRMNLPLLIKTEDATQPEVWKKLKPLVDEIKQDYAGRIQVSWFYESMSEATKAFTLDEHGNAQVYPQDRATFSQLMLLFEPADLESFLDDSRKQILISFHIPFEGSRDYFDLKESVETYLSANQLEGYFVGRVSSFFETGHRMGGDTLRGLVFGGILIFIVLAMLFRSLPLALAGIIVNTLPVLTGLAVLGILDIDVDMGSSIVAAVAFGIVLDDSTHLLVRVRGLVASGYDPSTAVTRAVSDLFMPIVSTTVMICVGYSVLLFAEMQTFNDFSVVILITLVTALLSDILVLPMLVRRFFSDPLALST
jgi:uncharacterized protein